MHAPLVEQIASLGVELNANQYKVVRLAAEYDTTLDWFHDGFKSPSVAIARTLGIHDSTAREWIRVGHALDELPLIHDAFARNELSYAKARIVTRWADSENEADLLELAHDRTANRLTLLQSRVTSQVMRPTRSATSVTTTIGPSRPTPMVTACSSSESQWLRTSASMSLNRSTRSSNRWPQRRSTNRVRT